MKLKMMLVLLVSTMLFVGCSSDKGQAGSTIYVAKSNNPEDVIKQYFEGYEERDAEKVYTTLTETYKKVHSISVSSISFENIKSTKLLSVKDITDTNKEYVLHYIQGSNIAEENIKLYEVKFEWNLVDDTEAPAPNGEFIRDFFLTREDSNSDWLIKDMGH
jgi:PBP1b-binding outer membrane lipoprotein LpoB